MKNSAVKVCNLRKVYAGNGGGTAALDGVSFDAEEGEIFGLIGPDGAGKTTLMRIVATLLLPDSGTAEICGFDAARDCRRIRQIIGYMPGKFSLYQDLTIEENIAFFAKVFGVRQEDGIKYIKEIYCRIEPFKKRLAGRLSGGMKQKLALCCALIHRPKLLVLDEPTTGVDPVSRQEFWDILQNMKKIGISVLVSTPYMDEAARCDRIAFISSGKILKTDSPQNIVAAFPKKIFRASGGKMFELLKALRGSGLAESAYSFGDSCHIVPKGGAGVEDLKKCFQSSAGNFSVAEASATLEDCFMELNSGERNRS